MSAEATAREIAIKVVERVWAEGGEVDTDPDRVYAFAQEKIRKAIEDEVEREKQRLRLRISKVLFDMGHQAPLADLDDDRLIIFLRRAVAS